MHLTLHPGSQVGDREGVRELLPALSQRGSETSPAS